MLYCLYVAFFQSIALLRVHFHFKKGEEKITGFTALCETLDETSWLARDQRKYIPSHTWKGMLLGHMLYKDDIHQAGQELEYFHRKVLT